ncbi:MAG: [CysO sulfur-carrier protein]-S-L-cysteine hydrolase [Thermoleophilaceae bacterium]|jgi:proteasome lid subunit RPN8/RPN11|nr:[CysO sulfur-carrier protein]-S-L-cysteine hydrolase [Thermoleophilaceae bacterium]
MVISQAHWDALVAHAQEDAPNECCGVMRLRDGRVEDVTRGRNERSSPYAYELDPKSLFRANDLDDEGYGVAVYHSHPKSEPKPSQTDINIAFYPDWLYAIVSLAGAPEIRAWWIRDGRVEEEDIVVE